MYEGGTFGSLGMGNVESVALVHPVIPEQRLASVMYVSLELYVVRKSKACLPPVVVAQLKLMVCDDPGVSPVKAIRCGTDSPSAKCELLELRSPLVHAHGPVPVPLAHWSNPLTPPPAADATDVEITVDVVATIATTDKTAANR
jgi:hypothetical protein